MCDSMGRYQTAGEALAEELAAALSTADVDALRSELARAGFVAWKRWGCENRAAISAFLRATPAERRRKKAWRDPGYRRRLTLAALQQAHLASAVLDARASLQPGGSWRDTCVDAAEYGQHIVDVEFWDWPFDDPDPF